MTSMPSHTRPLPTYQGWTRFPGLDENIRSGKLGQLQRDLLLGRSAIAHQTRRMGNPSWPLAWQNRLVTRVGVFAGDTGHPGDPLTLRFQAWSFAPRDFCFLASSFSS